MKLKGPILGILISCLTLSVALIAYAHLSTAQYYLSLPSFCRLPGMEPYLFHMECGEPGYEAYRPTNLLLLDGPPPRPIYWADFQELYGLQRRMIGELLNASVCEDEFSLRSLPKDLRDEQSTLSRFRAELERRNYWQEEVLRETLLIGARSGRTLVYMPQNVKVTVKIMAGLNKKAIDGMEKVLVTQPKGRMARAVAPLFPRFPNYVWSWSWEPDVEARWQFYYSLTAFTSKLYEELLFLDKFLREIEEYTKEMDSVYSQLTKKKEPSVPPSSGVNNTNQSSGWFKRSLPTQTAVPESKGNGDEEYEALKKRVLDGLVKAGPVAAGRVRAALASLRALSTEVEGLLHRVASPVPEIPLHMHQRHIYMECEKLDGMLSRME
ncbi:hypothetical protein NMY22_g6619 [Coprinellus aureogranulatus]|nr:hypothetical protein NMY22_g6619 [Coprinellus aureogranulatus]